MSGAGSGVVTGTHVAWKVTRNVPNRPSPVLSGDLLFMVDQDGGVVTCLEALTGKEVWKERLPGAGSPQAIAEFIAAERDYWGAIMKGLNVQPQ